MNNIIDSEAKIGEYCRFDPFVIVEAGAQIGDHCTFEAGVIIKQGAIIGDKCHLRAHTVVESNVILGDNVETGYNVVFRNGCAVGDNVHIWSNSVIDPGAVIHDGVRIHCLNYICQSATIKADAFIAPGCVLCNDKYPPRYDPNEWEAPIIEESAAVGGGCKVGPGVVIGYAAKLGMGSNVIRDVPHNQIWAGNPARRIR